MPLSRRLDTITNYVPAPMKPFLKPLYPVYQSALSLWFRALPERTVETPWGPKLVVNPSNFVERRLAYGVFEEEVINYFRENLIQEAEQFVDIGANIGFYSILFALLSEENIEVHAFEPLQSNVERFRYNLAENDITSVSIHEYALSNSIGTTDLLVSDEYPGETSMGSSPASSTPNRTEEVETKRLDDVVLGDGTLDLIKIDVEGAEFRVLDGACEYLSENSPELLLELHPERMEEFGDDIASIEQILKQTGYSSAVLIETLEQIDISGLSDLGYQGSIHLHVV